MQYDYLDDAPLQLKKRHDEKVPEAHGLWMQRVVLVVRSLFVAPCCCHLSRSCAECRHEGWSLLSILQQVLPLQVGGCSTSNRGLALGVGCAHCYGFLRSTLFRLPGVSTCGRLLFCEMLKQRVPAGSKGAGPMKS